MADQPEKLMVFDLPQATVTELMWRHHPGPTIGEVLMRERLRRAIPVVLSPEQIEQLRSDPNWQLVPPAAP